MNVALYATIWAALALFVAGEAGKRARDPRGLAASAAWCASMLGTALCALHMLIALATRHGWSHAAAVSETARRTAEVYGVAWRGGLYVNYAFLVLWLAEASWWRAAPENYRRRPRWLAAALRAFDLVIVVNAAIVFASPLGRVAGCLLVAGLLWVWRPVGSSTAGAVRPST